MEIDFAYIAVIICFIIGAITWFRPSPFYLRLFPIFLFISFIVESVAWWLSSSGKSNLLLYNIFDIFLFNFYFFALYNMVNGRVAKRAILIVMGVFTLLAISNFVFYQGLTDFHSLTYSIGCLFIVSICVYYFLELFRLPHSVNLVREPGFWICSGLIFFFSCALPILGTINIQNVLPKVLMDNVGILLSILNILLYTLYSIAFLCRINIKKSTQ